MDPWTTLPSNVDYDLYEIGLMFATSPDFADAFLRALTEAAVAPPVADTPMSVPSPPLRATG